MEIDERNRGIKEGKSWRYMKRDGGIRDGVVELKG